LEEELDLTQKKELKTQQLNNALEDEIHKQKEEAL
jgi:hypothetical protein